MKRPTYKQVLTLTRRQCINMLKGKYIASHGVSPYRLLQWHGRCVGCASMSPDKLGGKYDCAYCALRHIGDIMTTSGKGCAVGAVAVACDQSEVIFEIINTIDTMLEELDDN